MLFFQKNISYDDIKSHRIYNLLGTVLSAFYILTQKYASQSCYGTYAHTLSVIISGPPVKD